MYLSVQAPATTTTTTMTTNNEPVKDEQPVQQEVVSDSYRTEVEDMLEDLPTLATKRNEEMVTSFISNESKSLLYRPASSIRLKKKK